MSQWLEATRSVLLRLRDRTGAWGYRADRGPTSEATALCCLGLWSSRRSPLSSETRDAINRGADWLRQLQQGDGSIGVSPGLPHPGWATPYCLLLWKALDVYPQARQRASAWLLQEKGAQLEADEALIRMIVGDDQSLLGWPWVAGTHSWLEPTAISIMALDRQGLGDHPRVEEGIKMILDRALHFGGWNYGNKSIFGRALRPHPEPTGMALVALAARPGNRRPRAVDLALRYLRQVLPEIDAPCSLAWGVLGLRAWNACPVEADTWLARSFARHGGRRDITAGLGLLALAGGEPDLFTRKPLP